VQPALQETTVLRHADLQVDVQRAKVGRRMYPQSEGSNMLSAQTDGSKGANLLHSAGVHIVPTHLDDQL
jgi:hypothetical protein